MAKAEMKLVKKTLAVEPDGAFPTTVYKWAVQLWAANELFQEIVTCIENELEGDPTADDWESEPDLHVVKQAILEDMAWTLNELNEYVPESLRLIEEWIERRGEFSDRLHIEAIQA
jgi:hypothetical protein